MKLGLISAILEAMSYKEVIDYPETLSLSCVEVCCWPRGKASRRYAGVTHIDINVCSEAELLAHLHYAQAHGLEISSLGYCGNPLDSDPETASISIIHIKKLLAASASMGINRITTFIGRDKTKTVEDNLVLFKEVWSRIMDEAERLGVQVAIENCPMLYTVHEWPGGNNLACSPYIWREMFRLIPSNLLGLNYDPSHLYLMQADYVKPIYEFREKIFHVHLKDIKIHQNRLDEYGIFSYPALWHSPKIPGLGDMDFRAVISALHDIRYQGPVCIEVEDKAFEDSLENIQQAIEQSVRFLRQYL